MAEGQNFHDHIANLVRRIGAPLRNTSKKLSEMASLERPGQSDITTSTPQVECCSSSSSCKTK